MSAPNLLGDFVVQPLSAQVFYATSSDVQKMRSAIRGFTAQGNNLDHAVTSDDRDVLLSALSPLSHELVKFDCRTALSTVRKIDAGFQSAAITYARAMQLIDELDERIRDELEFVTAFTLTAQEANLINPQGPLISEEFFTRFPRARFDVEECAKCLAYGRATAGVFHAMRIMEISVTSVARCLGIPDPVKPGDKSWGKILEAIKAKIDERWPNMADREDGDGQAFEDIYAMLRAIKNAWRNKTMHPARKYTEEEAGKIITVSTQFLVELARRMDEEGRPLA